MRALAWALVGLCASAAIAAADQPKLWITDLVAGDGAEHPARELGVALRDEAAATASQYVLVAADDGDNPCRTTVCVAAVARDRGADVVIAGRIDAATTAGVEGFAIELRLVDAKTASVLRRWSAFVAKPELHASAGAAYRALTEARGEPLSAPPPPQRGDRRWKIAAGVAGAMTVGSAVAFAVYVSKLRETGPAFKVDSNDRLVVVNGKPVELGSGYGGYCQRSVLGYAPTAIDENGRVIAVPDACSHGHFYEAMTYVTAVGTLTGIGFTAYAAYKGYVARDEHPSKVVVTPAFAPDAAGATLSIRW